MKLINNKGDLSWELIALMIVGLMVLVIILIFSGTLKTKIAQSIEYISVGLLGR